MTRLAFKCSGGVLGLRAEPSNKSLSVKQKKKKRKKKKKKKQWHFPHVNASEH